MKGMSVEERISRDGDRWRYVYFLERELEKRATRQSVTSSLLAYSIIVTYLAIYLATS